MPSGGGAAQSAARAAVCAGDVVAAIEGENVEGWLFAKVVDALRKRQHLPRAPSVRPIDL